jgi:DNA invertase Pin-like site-specific DNA recombinase
MNTKTPHAERFIGYLRVSTGKQARSGLGMDAQENAIKRFIEQRPGTRLLKTFRENRSGADDGRPELREALGLCRRIGATLLVAKLDRISRRQGFLIDLRDSGQKFVLADMPDLDEKMLPFFMMIAEYERQLIRDRTKAALASLKRRGVLLGSARLNHWENIGEDVRLNGLVKARRVSITVRYKKFAAKYSDVKPRIDALRSEGRSYREITEILNAETRQYLSEEEMTEMGRWDAMKVRRVAMMTTAA